MANYISVKVKTAPSERPFTLRIEDKLVNGKGNGKLDKGEESLFDTSVNSFLGVMRRRGKTVTRGQLRFQLPGQSRFISFSAVKAGLPAANAAPKKKAAKAPKAEAKAKVRADAVLGVKAGVMAGTRVGVGAEVIPSVRIRYKKLEVKVGAPVGIYSLSPAKRVSSAIVGPGADTGRVSVLAGGRLTVSGRVAKRLSIGVYAGGSALIEPGTGSVTAPGGRPIPISNSGKSNSVRGAVEAGIAVTYGLNEKRSTRLNVNIGVLHAPKNSGHDLPALTAAVIRGGISFDLYNGGRSVPNPGVFPPTTHPTRLVESGGKITIPPHSGEVTKVEACAGNQCAPVTFTKGPNGTIIITGLKPGTTHIIVHRKGQRPVKYNVKLPVAEPTDTRKTASTRPIKVPVPKGGGEVRYYKGGSLSRTDKIPKKATSIVIKPIDQSPGTRIEIWVYCKANEKCTGLRKWKTITIGRPSVPVSPPFEYSSILVRKQLTI